MATKTISELKTVKVCDTCGKHPAPYKEGDKDCCFVCASSTDKCENCTKSHFKNNLTLGPDKKKYCYSCYSKLFGECYSCSKTVPMSEILEMECCYELICKSCALRLITKFKTKFNLEVT